MAQDTPEIQGARGPERPPEGDSAALATPHRRTEVGLWTLGAAVAAGVAGDALFRVWPLGANVPLWTLVVIAVAAGLAAATGRWSSAARGCLLLPALLFAATFAWRDSPLLLAVNVAGLLTALALVPAFHLGASLRRAGLLDMAGAVIVAGLNACFGMLILLFGTIQWDKLPGGRPAAVGVPVARGVLVAAPLVFMFGGLFMAADAAFEIWVKRLLDWNIEEIILHALVAAAFAWVVAGWLRQTVFDETWPSSVGDGRPFLAMGVIEISVVLGSLLTVFLGFVLVQLRYFFGGVDLIEASRMLTYAEYARRGFFELVTVAGLLLPVLMFTGWSLRRDDPRVERVFRVLAGALLLLLCIVVVSALQRMRLYTEEFGLTELRLYPTVFMGWLVVVFGWFAATVLRGRPQSFTFGALVAGFVAIGALNVANPDDLIARVNTARGEVSRPANTSAAGQRTTPTREAFGRPVDAHYLTSLSADAVPALVQALPSLPEPERRVVAQHLLRAWKPPEAQDWRSWSLARVRAWDIVRSQTAMIAEAAQ